MSNDPSSRKLGKRDGIRYAITWLHRRAEEMNDQHAKAVLNSAAFYLGNEIREGHMPSVPDAAEPPGEGSR
jgi:hypothetical protein